MNDIQNTVNPFKSELFGDLIAPVMGKFEHPAVINMAYEEYVNKTTQRGVDYYDARGPHYSQAPISVMTPEQFKETGQHRQWIPLLKKQRGTVDSIMESAKRNSNRINLEQSVKEAKLKGQDPEEIYKQLEKDDLLNLVDPVEGILANTAGIMGGMWQTAKEEGLAGATIGAAGAAAVGQAGPQVLAPEEVVTVPSAALGGFQAGTIYGWYKQGSGALSYELWKKGNTSKSADMIADTAAIPYAFLDNLQLMKLIPAKFKRQAAMGLSQLVIKRWPEVFTKLLPKAGKEYAKTMGEEVGIELIQDGTMMFAEDIADYLNGQGVPYDKKLLKERANQFFENAKTYTKSFALLPIVGTAMNSYADMQVDMTDFTDMNTTGLSADQLRTLVSPEIAKQRQQKVETVQKLADSSPEEFNKAYDAMSPEEQEAFASELVKSKQVNDVTKGTAAPTQDDIDNALAAFVPMNQAKQISPVVLTDEQITNVQNNIEARVRGEVVDEQDVRDKAYIKGFAARLTVISNTADNMVVGAGKPEQQKQVLQSEIKSVVDSYNNISELIDQNPETLKELTEIKKLIPGYEKAVNDFVATPSKEGFKNIRTIGKQIAELGNQYADRVSRGTIETFKENQETVETTRTPAEQAKEDKIVHRVVSRFPAKIKDQKSLETVGNLIAKDLGVTDPVVWHYLDSTNIPNEDIATRVRFEITPGASKYIQDTMKAGGMGGFRVTQRGKSHIFIINSGKVSEGSLEQPRPGQAGRKLGFETPSQSSIKRTIVHELGHQAKPPFTRKGKRYSHYPDYVKWVDEGVDRLMGYWDKGVVVPGKMKTDVDFIENNQGRDNLSDAIGSGQEIAPDGTVQAPVTAEEAVSALKKMLTEFKEASKDRVAEIKLLRAKQYATMQSILGKYAGSKTFAKALGAIKDVVADITFDWKHPISDSVYEKLCEMISFRYQDSFRQITAWKALNALRAGHSLTFSEKQALAGAFNLTPDQIPSGSKKYSLGEIAIEMWNVPRMLLAGFFDNSMLLRQMFPALLDSPVIWAKSAGKSFKALFSPNYAQSTMAEIYNRPNFEMYQIMGIDLTGPGQGIENTAESNIGGNFLSYRPHKETDGFIKTAAKAVWNVGTAPYRASMRAADISTNTFRVNLADFYISLNKGLVNPFSEDGKKQMQYLGNHINRLTGRTNMGASPSLKKVSAVLNPMMFSLQLQVSRIGLLTSGTRATGDRLISAITGGKYQGKYNPMVRKAISNSFLKMATAIVGTVTLASMLWPGAVGDDPEQSGYGKVKIGNTFYDMTAGFGQYVRFVAQMLTGKKRSVTGNRYTVGRGAVMQQFARSKASPSVNIVWDAFSGRKVTGEPVDWSTQEGIMTNMWNYFGPMIMQDTLDILKNNPYQIAPGAMLAFVGMSVQSYPLMPSQQAVIMKKKLAVETFGKDWDQLGPSLQKALYAMHPELELQDRVVQATRNDWNSISLRTTESQLAGKKVMKQLPQHVQEELIGLNLTVGGLSRQIGSSQYFLNEQRFETYKGYVTQLLNEVLPNVVGDSEYQGMESEARYKLMESLITKLKKVAREQVLNETKQVDIQTLSEMK
jgi:hypothetical protein